MEELERARRYLAEREEEQRRAREKERPRVTAEVRKTLKDVAPKYGISKAYFYGSFLAGDQGPDSDVDLAVEEKFSFSDFGPRPNSIEDSAASRISGSQGVFLFGTESGRRGW